ncbi:hypothetical protein [Streptomyces sp. NP10]|uniref:hypothetical protein n=1 Tax=Streptomyces sp. NP10 TaxID=1141731 RepID=UPI000F85DAC6|nr:hypothetical protein [Streptomyces sp. NP10]
MIASAVALLTLQGPQAVALSDSESVFCQAKSNRQSLVDAGISIGVLSSASSVDSLRVPKAADFSGADALSAWAKSRTGDFKKTCQALIGAAALGQGNSPKKESRFDFFTWLLPIVAGALLTMIAAEAQAGRSRKLSGADELRLAAATFRDATNRYVTGWAESLGGGRPSTVDIGQSRLNLVSSLRKASLRGTWPFADQLVSLLEGDMYGADIGKGWTGTQTDTRLKAEAVRSHLTRLEADVEQVARCCASAVPLWMRPSRKKTPTSIMP